MVDPPDDPIRMWRDLMEHALRQPARKTVHSPDGKGGSVCLIPHVIAREVLRRLDDGVPLEEIGPWFDSEMNKADRWRFLYRWRRRRFTP